MIISTTPNIPGHEIRECKGLVFGEVVAGVNFVKDFFAGFSNFFGGRSGSYEKEIINAREEALQELKQRTEDMGCNAVVGVKVDYETIGSNGNYMMMVTASGTAVSI
ncbi:MAG: hypothetical protein CR988_01280 [Treponema sp.]|nr:MAG: hypothetical protein CR988_01280 [Treponema sp.]